MLTGSEQILAGLLEIPSVEGGLQTVGWLRPGVDAAEVARKAALRNIEVIPLGTFFGGDTVRQGLQLGFAAVEPRDIRRGLMGLASIIRESRGE